LVVAEAKKDASRLELSAAVRSPQTHKGFRFLGFEGEERCFAVGAVCRGVLFIEIENMTENEMRA